MNIRRISPAESRALWRLVCYGRATPATVARVLGMDRRTAQKLTAPEALAALIPKPEDIDLAEWYNLLDSDWHTWTGADGQFHTEAQTARAVRDILSTLAVETIGEKMKPRMIEGIPPGHDADRIRDALRQLLKGDGITIPDGLARHYRHHTKPTFSDAAGNPL